MPLNRVIEKINFVCESEKGRIKIKFELGRNYKDYEFNTYLDYNLIEKIK